MDTKRRLYESHAEICKALSHPKRLEILDILRNGEYAVEEIAEKTGMQKSNLSQHLAVLRRVQLVRTRREGLNIFYAIANPKIITACDLLKEVLLESWTESGSLASAIEREL
jgi:Predicted transcriptional regulators